MRFAGLTGRESLRKRSRLAKLGPYLKKVQEKVQRLCSSCSHNIRFFIHANFQMASYDSDSSLDDQTEYTETGVLLGYASKEATEDAISHLGGIPVGTSHPLLNADLC
jgi:hypothetical protein